MATASDIINMTKRKRLDPLTGQPDTAPASEIIAGISGPSLVNTPMEFGTGADVVPEALYGSPDQSQALTEAIQYAAPQNNARPLTDLSKLYEEALGPEPQAPGGYEPGRVSVEKPTVKHALIEALKGYIPGYRHMKEDAERQEGINVASRNAMLKQQADDEAANYRAKLTDQRTKALNIATASRWEEMIRQSGDNAAFQHDFQLKMLDWRNKTLQAKVNSEFTKIKGRNLAFDSFMVPNLRRQGKSEDYIDQQRQITLGPEAARVFATINPAERYTAVVNWFKSMGWSATEDEMQNMLRMNKTATGQSGANLTPVQVKAIVDEMESGRIDPRIRGYYRNSAPIVAEQAIRNSGRVARREAPFDYNLAQQEREASSKVISSVNSSQFLRSQSAVNWITIMKEPLEQLIDAWRDAGGISRFQTLNWMTLQGSKQLGGPMGEAARNLERGIISLQKEVSIVLNAGYAPSQLSDELAQAHIKADWNEPDLRAALEQIDQIMKGRNWAQEMVEPVSIGGKRNRYYVPSREEEGKPIAPESRGTTPAIPGTTPGAGSTRRGRAPVIMGGMAGPLASDGSPTYWMTSDGKAMKAIPVQNVQKAIDSGAGRLATPQEVRGAGQQKSPKAKP